MNLEINCPECGYNSYRVRDKISGKESLARLSKCEDGSCDLDVENEETMHEQDFSELTNIFNVRYEIVEVLGINCTEV